MTASYSSLGPIDRAFVQSLIAWDVRSPEENPDFWSRFSTEWRDRVESHWRRERTRSDAAEALSSLSLALEAMSRPDPRHIHPSWWVRAAEGESMAVRLAMARYGSHRVALAIRSGMGIDPDANKSSPPNQAALEWVLCLFAERLVGGLPLESTDAPVVHAIVASHGTKLLRLARTTALAKLAYADAGAVERGSEPELPPLSRREQARYGHFVAVWSHSGTDTRLVRLALWDAEDRSDSNVGRLRSRRRELSRLGVTSLGRLLSVVDATRARWTLQHLPYSLAKNIRSRMTLRNPLVSGRGLAQWEGALWRLAATRLDAEFEGGQP